MKFPGEPSRLLPWKLNTLFEAGGLQNVTSYTFRLFACKVVKKNSVFELCLVKTFGKELWGMDLLFLLLVSLGAVCKMKFLFGRTRWQPKLLSTESYLDTTVLFCNWILLLDKAIFVPASIGGVLLMSWSDRIGRKTAMVISLITTTLSSALFVFSVHFA